MKINKVYNIIIYIIIIFFKKKYIHVLPLPGTMVLKLGNQPPVMHQILKLSFTSLPMETFKTKHWDKMIHRKVIYKKLI